MPSGRSTAIAVLLVVAAVAPLAAPEARAQSPAAELLPADAELRAAIVDSVTYALNKGYVFEDIANDIEEHLRGKLINGEYDGLQTIDAFARQLTEDVRAVSHDRHMSVRYFDPARVAETLEDDEDEDLARERIIERLKKDNFHFRKLEMLPGNVGYLKLNQFVDAPLSGPTATAAMNFLANSDAVIIDLRENGGGSPSLIQMITAYFLEESTHLNSFYTRDGDSLEQFWSYPYVPGPRMPDVDLYVLTSAYTFSGAEEFTYNLKTLGRATIVGETTGGGAHPIRGELFPSLNVFVTIPYARAINPRTGTNWEGTGVEPDVAVPADQALDAAHMMALEEMRKELPEGEVPFALDWAIEGLRARLNPVTLEPATLEGYAGQYGPRRLWVEDGALHYQRDEGKVWIATPMTETLFRFEGLDRFRLEVVLDGGGRPTKLVGHYDNGTTDESPRS